MLQWLGAFVVKVADLVEAEGRLARSAFMDVLVLMLWACFGCCLAAIAALLLLASLWWCLALHLHGAAALALTGGASGLAAVIVLLVFAGQCRRKT